MVSTLVAYLANPCKLGPAGLQGPISWGFDRYQTDTSNRWATPYLFGGQL